MPVYDEYKGLWIKLTICGVTRLGYGDGPDPKQRISDAIRNGAMRFGVALYLWGKDELESLIGNETVAASRKRRPPRSSTPVPRESSSAPPRAGGEPNRMPATDEEAIVTWLSALNALSGRPEPLRHLSDLSAAEGAAILVELEIT